MSNQGILANQQNLELQADWQLWLVEKYIKASVRSENQPFLDFQQNLVLRIFSSLEPPAKAATDSAGPRISRFSPHIRFTTIATSILNMDVEPSATLNQSYVTMLQSAKKSLKWGSVASDALLKILQEYPRDSISSKEIALKLNKTNRSWVFDSKQIDNKVTELRNQGKIGEEWKDPSEPAAAPYSLRVPANRPPKPYAQLRAESLQNALVANAAVLVPTGFSVSAPVPASVPDVQSVPFVNPALISTETPSLNSALRSPQPSQVGVKNIQAPSLEANLLAALKQAYVSSGIPLAPTSTQYHDVTMVDDDPLSCPPIGKPAGKRSAPSTHTFESDFAELYPKAKQAKLMDDKFDIDLSQPWEPVGIAPGGLGIRRIIDEAKLFLLLSLPIGATVTLKYSKLSDTCSLKIDHSNPVDRFYELLEERGSDWSIFEGVIRDNHLSSSHMIRIKLPAPLHVNAIPTKNEEPTPMGQTVWYTFTMSRTIKFNLPVHAPELHTFQKEHEL